LDIAILNGPHQALVKVVIDISRFEVWVVKIPFYQTFTSAALVQY
jgi:hypothetical protein